MQTAIFCNTRCLGPRQTSNRQRASVQQLVRPRTHRPRPSRRLSAPQASSALALDIGSPSNFQAVTNIVSAVLLGVGAWWYLRTQDKTEGQEICPKCHGSGVIECFCRKWSDNDVGCGTCGGTGKMVCNSCNGGGTAVPIEAKVHIERRKRFDDSYHSIQTHSQTQHTCKQCGRKHCQHHSAVR